MEGLGRWYLCTKLTDWTASIRRTPCRSRTRTRVEWQRTELPDCPAQHGGAKRQQRPDLAASAETRRYRYTRTSVQSDRAWRPLDLRAFASDRLANHSRPGASFGSIWFAADLDLPSRRSYTMRDSNACEGFQTAMNTHSCCSALTFDMRGGWKQAKPAGRRPLDGRVRQHCRQAGGTGRRAQCSCRQMRRRLLARPGRSSTWQEPAMKRCSEGGR